MDKEKCPMNKECPTNKECPKECPNKDLGKEFLDSLNEKERMAYHIAKSHLGTMFSLDKSNAFLEWVNERHAKEA